MNAVEFLLAMLFIASPADKLNSGKVPDLNDYLAPRIAAAARQMELLDPREKDHFTKPIEFAADLKMIRDRYEKLRDAPMLSDAEQFPDLALINQSILTNRAYRDSVIRRTDLTAQKLATIITEVERLYRIYDTLRDTRCEYFYVTYRRERLSMFRSLIGGRAFSAGQMPLPLPTVIRP